MNTFQKAGGMAALAHAFAYLVGIILAVTLIFPVLNGNPDGYFEYVRDNPVLMHTWILITYWGSAVSVVFMALALYHRLNTRSPLIMQAATVFGLIWAGLIIASANLMLNDFRVITELFTNDPSLTPTAWTILEAVENGIISGNELVGSLWVSLVCLAALRQNGLTRPLATLGVTLGVVGLVTLVFPEACFVFGLCMVIWSIWLGVEFLQTKVEVAA
ncbi:MAG: DUF4386 family protein [Chloroflexi bacterium]|jgi:hypothetical protein|nr:DUF4386 family protein [Chloroflexota bacterium]BCY16506.1 hypothetical protein hrd7_03550 [Leptolinea sp. HRD-7]